MDLIKELERRNAITRALQVTVERLYVDSPHGKIRRNEVHRAIGEAMGVLISQSIPARKLVIEVLKARGVKLITNSGRRYFKGLEKRC